MSGRAEVHRPVPLDAYENAWRCSCGEVFVSEAGWAVCPLAPPPPANMLGAPWWFPPPRALDGGHRVSLRPGMRPVQTRDLPGPVAGLSWAELWRARLILWAAEITMRAAAREMGRLPRWCHDQVEPDPFRLDGCTCEPVAGSHRRGCAWAVWQLWAGVTGPTGARCPR